MSPRSKKTFPQATPTMQLESMTDDADSPVPTLTVLGIDDNPADVELARLYLEEVGKWNVEFVGCTDPMSGLSTLASRNVDIVLLDYRLGELTGLQLLDEIRRAGHNCPVIMLSSTVDVRAVAGVMRAGASDFVTKDALGPGVLERVIGTALDKGRLRSEISRYQAELGAKNIELERRRGELSDFQSNLAHELKTPLTAVHDFANILADGLTGELTEGQAECVAHIQRGADQLRRFIDDMVDSARLDLGKFTARLERGDLSLAVAETVGSLTPTVEAKGLSLTTSIEEGLPDVLVDRSRIGQVLANLVNNAAKFTPAGGRIDVRAARAPQGGVQVEVCDTGRGIDAESLPKLFERSFQVHRSDASQRGGLGLGLHICKEIVELHGGELSVESELGRGTTFRFTVPVEGRSEVASPSA